MGKKPRKSATAPAGWMVQAYVCRVGAQRTMLLFSAAIPDPDDAVEAVRQKLGGLHVDGPYAIAPMTKRALGSLQLGEVHGSDHQLMML